MANRVRKSYRGSTAPSGKLSRMQTSGVHPSRKLLWSFLVLVLVSTVGVVVFCFNSTLLPRLIPPHHAGLNLALNSLDYSVISFLNRLAHVSWTLDSVAYLIDSTVLGALPLAMAIWWGWFKEGEDRERHREHLLFGIFSMFLAIFLARVLSSLLAFRERPLRNPALHFTLPYHMSAENLLGWSSFPSDHAAMWFALIAAMFFVSRRAGAALFVYVCLGPALCRVYMGEHYPTDILAGGLIGLGTASLARYSAIRTKVTRRPLSWVHTAPQLFYCCLFVLTTQIAESFSSTAEIASYVLAFVKAAVKLL